tara:strand:+ start:654 stop:1166 length:513 start_codon:yes stop_codon:yes gene_type:complete
METVKISTNSEPFYTEVEVQVFEVDGHRFGWSKDNQLEFIHIYSGLGFNCTNIAVKKTWANHKKRFDIVVNHIGEKRFWDTVKSNISIDERIKKDVEIGEENQERREAFLELKKIIPAAALDKYMLMARKVAIDIVALDDTVQPNEGESLEGAITRKYGEQTAELVRKLM